MLPSAFTKHLCTSNSIDGRQHVRIFSFIRKNDNNITVNVQRLCGSALSIGEIHSKKKNIQRQDRNIHILCRIWTRPCFLSTFVIFFLLNFRAQWVIYDITNYKSNVTEMTNLNLLRNYNNNNKNTNIALHTHVLHLIEMICMV